MPIVCTRVSLVCHSYVTRMYSYVIRVSFVCTLMSSVCHSYIFVCDPYVTRMYSYVIRVSLVLTGMSSVCHSYGLVCHPYVTRMGLYVIRMSLVCHPYVTHMGSYVIRMSLVWARMSYVYHSYVLVCHPFVTTTKNTGNQEYIVTLLLDNITFLKGQLRQKDKVKDSLINQLSKQDNYLLQKRNTDNQLETNLESVKSKEESVKSKETEQIIITANDNKTEDTEERKSEKDSKTSISNNKSSQKDISHEVEPTNTSNSQENIENNDIERGKDVTLQNQEISPEKNFTPSSTEKHISHDTKANKSKYWEIRNP